MTHFENPLRLARELKGAPLSILFVLSAVRQPVRQEWIERHTGYTDKPISQALAYLEEHQFIEQAPRSGWQLTGKARQLPLVADMLPPESEISDEPAGDEIANQEILQTSEDLQEDSKSRNISDSPYVVVVDVNDSKLNKDSQQQQQHAKSRNFSDFLEKLPPEQAKIYRLLDATGAWPSISAAIAGAESVCFQDVLAKLDELYDPASGISAPHKVIRCLLDGNFASGKYYDHPGRFVPAEILERAGLADLIPQVEAYPEPDIPPAPDVGLPTSSHQAAELPPHPPAHPSAEMGLNGPGSHTAAGAWRAAVDQLRLEMPKAAFETYVQPAWLHAYDPQTGALEVAAPGEYCRDWLESRLTSTLARILAGIAARPVTVRFVIQQELPDEP